MLRGSSFLPSPFARQNSLGVSRGFATTTTAKCRKWQSLATLRTLGQVLGQGFSNDGRSGDIALASGMFEKFREIVVQHNCGATHMCILAYPVFGPREVLYPLIMVRAQNRPCIASLDM